MDEFNVHDTAELIETKDFEKANRYLQAGWRLVHLHTWDFGEPRVRDQKTVYCLGWPKSLGSPQHPMGRDTRAL